MTRSTLKFMLALFVLLASVTAAAAQTTTTGSISGTVVDEKGATLPSANVTVRNTETNETRTAQTDEDGRYRRQPASTTASTTTTPSTRATSTKTRTPSARASPRRPATSPRTSRAIRA